MKLKLLGFIICVFFSIATVGQNIEHFVGKYETKGICFIPNNYYDLLAEFEDVNFEEQDFLDSSMHVIEITKAEVDTIDLQVLLQSSYLAYANILSDSTFLIFPQPYQTISNIIGIYAEGLIVDNYLKIYYKFSDLISVSCKATGYKKIPINIQNVNTNKLEIRLFPNPVQTQLNIQLSKSFEATLNSYAIYDAYGIIVMQNQLNYPTKKINIGLLKNGTYIIHFLNDDVEVASNKFIKVE